MPKNRASGAVVVIAIVYHIDDQRERSSSENNDTNIVATGFSPGPLQYHVQPLSLWERPKPALSH